MVPSAWVFLADLPLLANGKANRKALPGPGPTPPEAPGSLAARGNPVEDLVAGIWADVLGLARVGVDDNFFELGGHSLLVTKVVSRLRAAFQLEIPLQSVFEAPTVAGISATIARLREGGPGVSAPPLRPVDRSRHLPLSCAQQRLWFFDQLEPGNISYNLPSAIRLAGTLNVAALEQGLREIVRRHEVLRTTFVTRGEEPVQVIASAPSLGLRVVDLGGLPEGEREARAQELAAQEALRPLDLASGPLLRATLLHLGAEEHVLLLTMHHIVSDGWSMGEIFFRELAALYEAFVNGRPSPLPELPIQYADYAVWQRQWLQGEVLGAKLAYWKERLTGAPALDLPTDRPRSELTHFRGERQLLQLPSELARKLESLSRKEGVTLFMTLLAGFQVLLSRYTGQEDVCVGTPIANRDQAELEGLIGFFVNTLVLRTDLTGNPSFRELLKRVRAVCLGAYAHQDLPFEKLVEELHPERDLSRSPLFQVLFALQDDPESVVKLPGLTLSPLQAERSITAKFDLTLGITQATDGLRAVLKYNADLFDSATITQMLGYFQTLLEGIVDHPERPLASLSLFTEAERRQVLVEWNGTAADFPRERCVHDLIAEQARHRPEATALAFPGGKLTYAELDRRANRLARDLEGLGVGPEGRVGLCLERGPELIIGVLAALKAGAAYIPLDPAFPPERLDFLLRDAEAQVLLTQRHLSARLPASHASVVCLDGDGPALAQEEADRPQRRIHPDNLAYIIYTSGSTGRPKGVLVGHRGLTNLVTAQVRAFDIRPGDRLLQFISPVFDAAQAEIFRTLAGGATLCLANAEALLPGTPLLAFLQEQRITCAALPPSALAALPPEAALPALRTVVVAGEACPAELAAHWSQGRRLVNAYGPTEATICATLAEAWDPSRPPPLGRPLANLQAYVLDRSLRPVPAGIPGELYLGGVGLARGYLHQPALTAEKFLANPFSAEPGARLYRTGDRVRWRADGDLEFLGRLDEQVKVRGYRIEPGEVEAVLRQHPSVGQAAVVARSDGSDASTLVGYVVPREPPGPSAQELRHFLQGKLPAYMVPSAFVTLGALPLLANGKLNRKALPAPGPGPSGRDGVSELPRDRLEFQLTQIWEDVLDTHPVGIRDNFFDLGGHSLLAVRLMARVERDFGKKLPLAILFQRGTVEDLAVALREQVEVPPESPLVEIQPCGSKSPFFCIHPAGGNVFCYAPLAHHLGRDQPFYGLKAPILDGERDSFARLEEMAGHYADLARTVQPEGPYFIGGWCTGGIVAFEMARQLRARGQEVALLAMLETDFPAPDRKVRQVDAAKLMHMFARKRGLSLSLDDLKGREPDQQLAYVLERARAAGLSHAEIEGFAEIPRVYGEFAPIAQANARLTRRYVPQAYPGRAAFFRSTDGPVKEDHPDPAAAWGRLIAGLEVYPVPGNHNTMLREPHVRTLAERLKICLDIRQENHMPAPSQGSPGRCG
jgi:amino acid adenylation domain-containing protein